MSTENSRAASSGDQTWALRLMRRTAEAATEFAQRQVQALDDRVDHELTEIARQAATDTGGAPLDDQQSSIDADIDTLQQFRAGLRRVEAAYQKELDRALNCFLEGGRYSRQPETELDDDSWLLQVVDDNQLEEQLAVERMGSRALRRYEEALYQIGTRVARCTQAVGLRRDAHPLEPGIISETFSAALGTLDFSLQARLRVLELFEQVVLGELETLYREIDRILTDAGLTATRASARPTAIGGAVPARPGAGANCEPTQSDGGYGSGQPAVPGDAGEPTGQSPVPTDAAAAAGTGSVQLDELFRLLQQTNAPQASNPAPTNGETGATAPVTTPAPAQSANTVAVDANQLVGVLTQLQRSAAAGDAERRQHGDLKSGVLEQLQGESEPGTAAGIARQDDQTIDVVSLLFDYVLDDPAIPELVRGLVARLQIPVVKVALLDPSFFTTQEHPARRLINTLAESSVGLDDAESEEARLIIDEVRHAVERIANEFEDDTATFETVRQEFEEHLADVQARAAEREREAIEAIAEADDWNAARSVAGDSIERIIGDAPLPEIIAQFLRETWRDLLAAIYLTYGADSGSWVRALNVASGLVWSLYPKRTQPERDELLQALPGLLQGLRIGMAHMKLRSERRDEVLSTLAQEHVRRARGERTLADRSESGRESAADPAPGGREDPDAQPLSLVDDREDSHADRDDAAQAPAPEPASEVSSDAEGTDAEAGAPVIDHNTFMARKVQQIETMLERGRQRRDRYHGVAANDTDDASADAALQYVQSMRTGTWVEMALEGDEKVHAKLAWQGRISGEYFFFNRRDQQITTLSEDDLAERLRQGTIRPLDESHVLDRALDALVADLGAGDSEGERQRA